MANATLEYLFSIDSPMDIIPNMYEIVQLLTSDVFIFIFLPLPFLASWIISKKVLLPTVLYMIIGTSGMAVAPWEYKQPFMVMLTFAGGGITYMWFKEKF